MIRASYVPLVRTGEPEAFVLPTNLAELLEKQIAPMEAQKRDIDILFVNCPEETFADPSCDWGDVSQEKDKVLREKDRARIMPERRHA